MTSKTFLSRQAKFPQNSFEASFLPRETPLSHLHALFLNQRLFVGLFGGRNFFVRINSEVGSAINRTSTWHTTTNIFLALLHETSRLRKSKLIRGLQVKCAGYLAAELHSINYTTQTTILLDDSIKSSMRYVTLFKDALTANPGCPAFGFKGPITHVLLLSVKNNDGRKYARLSSLKRRLTKRIVVKYQRRSNIF